MANDTSTHTTALEITTGSPWQPTDDPGTWSATVLQYTERCEGRDVDQSFMDCYMGGGPMVTEGQEVKLFVTEVKREPGCVMVTMNWRPVRSEQA